MDVTSGPGLLDLTVTTDGPSAGSGGASAVYDGPGLTAPLDAVLDEFLPEPEPG